MKTFDALEKGLDSVCFVFHGAEAGSAYLEANDQTHFKKAYEFFGLSTALHLSSMAWTGRRIIQLANISDIKLVGVISLLVLPFWVYSVGKLIHSMNGLFPGPISLDHWAERIESKIPEHEKKSISVYWTDNFYQRAREFFYCTEIVLNFALSYFSPSDPLPLINVATQVYSLLKIAQWKWLAFDRTIEEKSTFNFCDSWNCVYGNVEDHVLGYKVTYQTAFGRGCSEHDIQLLLIDDLYLKSSQFLSDLKGVEPQLIIKYRDGYKFDEYMKYKILLDSNQKLNCQVCKEELSQNSVTVSVWHTYKQNTEFKEATIEWDKDEGLNGG